MCQLVKTTWTSSVSQACLWKIRDQGIRKTVLTNNIPCLIVFWLWQRERKLKNGFSFKNVSLVCKYLKLCCFFESQLLKVINPRHWCLLKMYAVSYILVKVNFCLCNLRTKSLLKWKSMVWPYIFAWNDSKFHYLILTWHWGKIINGWLNFESACVHKEKLRPVDVELSSLVQCWFM